MKKFALTVSALALAASAFAGENFGGIGVTIYATSNGVRVVDVIPGSPAALAGLKPTTGFSLSMAGRLRVTPSTCPRTFFAERSENRWNFPSFAKRIRFP